ncbi:MAG TPA: hypothetical protein VGC36_08680 [Rhizomicrobium sp.]
MSASTIYTIGFFIVLGCGIYAAVLLRVPETWIVIGGLLANGLAIAVASSYEPPAAPPKP